jgi:negative regulator of flagellin synthesis FlgM
VLRLYGAQKSQPHEEQRADKAAQKSLPQGDRAEFSSEALDYRKLREAVLNIPETREDRVREIKNALQKGEYNVSADQIAEKILGRYLVDHLV